MGYDSICYQIFVTGSEFILLKSRHHLWPSIGEGGEGQQSGESAYHVHAGVSYDDATRLHKINIACNKVT